MKKSRFTGSQIAAILRKADRSSVAEVTKTHGISYQSLYAWRKPFGGVEAADVKRSRQLELENARWKKIVADRNLEIMK